MRATFLMVMWSLLATIASAATVNTTGFASTDGTRFIIDGKAAYLPGTNAYWLSFLTNDADIETALDHVAASGLKVVRIWGFNDVAAIPSDSSTVWFQYLSASGSQINTGTNGLQRLDAVVAAAEARDLKLIVNFVNNWDDYGGVSAYTTAFGGDHNGWFTNVAAQAQYRTYIAAVVSRYATSPAIFAWELMNEPRCTLCSTDVIFNWATSISAYIKSLDPHHMVALGDEGFGLTGSFWIPYWLVYGTDYWRNLQIETLDFGTFHLYPQTWFVPLSFGTGWITSHASKCAAANKPCILEEYGTTSDHCAGEQPWQQTSLETTGMAGDMFWQLGDTLSFGQTSDDSFTVYYGSSDWTCLVTEHVASIL